MKRRLLVGESDWGRRRATWRRRPWGYEGRRWECYFWFNGWGNIQLGLHVSLTAGNVELHVPFGFVRIGRGQYDVVPDDDPRLAERRDGDLYFALKRVNAIAAEYGHHAVVLERNISRSLPSGDLDWDPQGFESD